MQNMQKTFVALFVISIALIILLFTWPSPSHMVQNIREIFPNRRGRSDIEPTLKRLADNLIEIQHYTHSEELRTKLGVQLNLVLEMLQMVNKEYKHPTIFNKQGEGNFTKLHEVCPEEYKGKQLNYDYPLFRKGFASVDCKKYKPITTLVTLLLHMPSNPPKYGQTHLKAMESVAKYFPGITVHLATEEALNTPALKHISELNITFKSHVMKAVSQSDTWKSLVNNVVTPYVLVAPNITHFDDDINLERLVRVLSYYPSLAIAGGAHRNITGHWDMGCQQVTFRNWTAWYKGGYYRSFNDCVVCDHIVGPFMAKTEMLKKLELDASMTQDIFHDLFWRVKRDKIKNVIVSCPDVMFNILVREIPDVEYVRFANKHKIHKIVEPNGRVRWYGCRLGYPWTSGKLCSSTKGIGLSPSSMENLADGIKYFMKVCEEIGAFCEMQDGTSVGAVKLNGVLPWELDGDIVLQSANFSAVKKLVGKFKEAGYNLIPERDAKVNSNGIFSGGYMALKSGKWNIEIWGYSNFEAQMMVARKELPTRVSFVGQWVIVPRNPGLFIRNRYGAGVYRHAQHWSQVGLETGWKFYNPGSFTKCPEPGHSACLDQFSGDGNMQFRDYPC